MAEIKVPGNIADEVVRSGHTFAKILQRALDSIDVETDGFIIPEDERQALAVDLVSGTDVFTESLEAADQIMDELARKEERSPTSGR